MTKQHYIELYYNGTVFNSLVPEANADGSCRKPEFTLGSVRKAIKCHHLNLLLAVFSISLFDSRC